jgi:hypothetical protein
VINFDNATVEEFLENFLQRRIVIAPEVNQQPFLPRIVPGSVLLITLSQVLNDGPRYFVVPFHRLIQSHLTKLR